MSYPSNNILVTLDIIPINDTATVAAAIIFITVAVVLLVTNLFTATYNCYTIMFYKLIISKQMLNNVMYNYILCVLLIKI